MVLAATAPTLLATSSFVGATLVGRNAYVLSEGDGQASLNESLAQALTSQPWAEVVSPEVFAPTAVRGEPVLVRGVDPQPFLRLEGTPEAVAFRTPYDAIIGQRLAGRLGVSVGYFLLVPGSTLATFVEVLITAALGATTAAGDELLVPFPVARSLTGLSPDSFHAIRLRTADVGSMVAFLQGRGASVHVSRPGMPTIDVNSGPVRDDRLANLALRSGVTGSPTGLVPTALAQGENSVRVVVLGIGAMVLLLVGLGAHAILARLLADKRATFETLRALGASRLWIRGRLAKEASAVAAPAILIGTVAGLAVSAALGQLGAIALFGRVVQPELTVPLVVLVIVTAFAIAVGAALLAANPFLRHGPRRFRSPTIQLGAMLR